MGRQRFVLQLCMLWKHWKEVGGSGEWVEEVIARGG